MDEQTTASEATIAPHHPTPPGSVSPTEHAQNFAFSSADDATPVKKPTRPRRRGAGFGGVRKRQPKKKKVRFNHPLEEVRLIDSQDPPIAASPASAFTSKAAVAYRPDHTHAARGIQWSGFGANHLPRHYPDIPAREAEEKAKEEEQARELNRTYVDR